MKEDNTTEQVTWQEGENAMSDGEIEINVEVDGDSFEDEEWNEGTQENNENNGGFSKLQYHHERINNYEGEVDDVGAYKRGDSGRVLYKGKRGFVFKDKEDPRHYGKCWALCYYNGNPLVIIGPDCNSLS